MLISSILNPLLLTAYGWLEDSCLWNIRTSPIILSPVVTQQVFELTRESTPISTVVKEQIALGQNINSNKRPLLIWHGLGDNYNSSGISQVIELVQSLHPGTQIYSLYADKDPDKDQSLSMFGDANVQIQLVCEFLANASISTVDAMGFSQGGLLLRGMVERCPQVQVKNLITFGSPHLGVQDLPSCNPNDWVCKKRNALLKSQVWLDRVQKTVLPAQYFRDPQDMENYMHHSHFLADINNEAVNHYNASYGLSMSRLETLVLVKFNQDTTLVPKESAWFSEIDPQSGRPIPFDRTNLYQKDLIGLKALNEKGKLQFYEVEDNHMAIPQELLVDLITEYVGKPINE